nr:anti-sigma-K factor rskA [uncultured bacterium]
MNDFSNLELELKRLRPVAVKKEFLSRLEKAMQEETSEAAPDYKVIRPQRFRVNWAIGIGLAAAAAVLLLVRVNFRPADNTKRRAAVSPSPIVQSENQAPTIRDQFIPEATTQVVYHERDEGLIFPRSVEAPLRRIRSQTRETLQWRNPATGASLRVSYPSEQVELIPVSGQ